MVTLIGFGTDNEKKVVAPWIKINDSNNCLKKNPIRKTKSKAKFVKFSKSVIIIY